MTLQQLFNLVNFDDLVPILIERDSAAIDHLVCFRQNFDIIRLAKVARAKIRNLETITLCFNEYDDEIFEGVRGCDYDKDIKEVVERPIDLSNQGKVSLNEIAAECLFEVSSEDFIEEESMYEYHNMEVNYGLHYDNHGLSQRQNPYHAHNLISYVDKIENYIERNNISGFDVRELRIAMYGGFHLSQYHSIDDPYVSPVDYVGELITKYDTCECIGVSRSFALITGNEKVLSGVESLKEILRTRFPATEIGIGINSDDMLTLLIILI